MRNPTIRSNSWLGIRHSAARGWMVALICVGSLALLALGATTLDGQSREQEVPGSESVGAKTNPPIEREGTAVLAAVGRFHTAGSGVRVSFQAKVGGQSYVILENLALERVSRTLADSSTSHQRDWIVDGILTEFRGSNYIMIQRAVMK